MRRKTRAQREAEILERLKKPRRILKGRSIVEFKARVEQAEFEYLEQLRADRCQARSKALTQVLRLYASGRTGAHCDTLLGYPMQWQIMGAGTTMNLSNGLPYYHGVVMFPSPILARSH